MRWSGWGGALLLTAGAVSGCAHDCTEMGCEESITVTFATPLTEAGTYRIEAVVDGVSMTCTTTVPPTGADDCGDTPLSPFGQGEEVRTSDAVTELPPTNLAGFLVQGRVGTLDFELFRDDAAIGSASLAPTYHGEEINGPGCGECFVANETVTLDGG